MSRNHTSRRMFLKGGALAAAPIAASVGAVALAQSADGSAGDESRARLVRLEDEAAIRALHRAWLRQVNAGAQGILPDPAVRRIIADQAGAADRIEIAADGRSAIGQFDCAVELETPLARDCTLAQMAHAQGHGSLRRTGRRRLTITYRRNGERWMTGEVALQTL